LVNEKAQFSTRFFVRSHGFELGMAEADVKQLVGRPADRTALDTGALGVTLLAWLPRYLGPRQAWERLAVRLTRKVLIPLVGSQVTPCRDPGQFKQIIQLKMPQRNLDRGSGNQPSVVKADGHAQNGLLVAPPDNRCGAPFRGG
jgi:hypothetical protein